MFKQSLLCAFCASMALSAMALEQPLIETPVNLDNGETGWYPGLCIDKTNFTSAQPGTVFTFEYTINSSSEGHSFTLCTNYSNTKMPGFEGTAGEKEMNLNVSEDGVYNYTITEEAIALLKDNGAINYDGSVRICGEGVTITKAYLTVSDEESLVTCPYDMTNNWWPGCEFGRGVITSAEVGWRIIMDYEILPGVDDAAFAITTNYGKTDVPGYAGSVVDGTRTNQPITESGSYTLTITQEAIDKLPSSDFNGWDGSIRIIGQGFTITKLVLVRSKGAASAINEVMAPENDGPVEYFNLQGQKVTNPSNGIYIKRQGSNVQKVVVR